MSKHNRHGQNRQGNNHQRKPQPTSWRNGVPVWKTPTNSRNAASVSTALAANPNSPPAKGKWIFQTLTHGRKLKVLVQTRKENTPSAMFFSRFERTKPRKDGKSGASFIAIGKLHDRPVFVDSKSPQPIDPNKVYGYFPIGENRDATVYFARVVMPEEMVKPTSIRIDVATGRMIGMGGRCPCLSNFKTKKPYKRPEVKDEADDAWNWFADNQHDYRTSDYDDDRTHSCGPDCEEGCDVDESPSIFDIEVAAITDSLGSRERWCHSCGCRDCVCDGTPTVDVQPYIMPYSHTQVRFPSRVRSVVRSHRNNWW